METTSNNKEKPVSQKWKMTKIENALSLAEKYYSVFSAVNSFKLTQREIQLIAFTAIQGNMSYNNIREDFCKMYNTSSPTINNIISKLKKMNILVKDRGKIKVHPILLLNFNSDVTLEIKLLHGE